jgi:hypothetical protein
MSNCPEIDPRADRPSTISLSGSRFKRLRFNYASRRRATVNQGAGGTVAQRIQAWNGIEGNLGNIGASSNSDQMADENQPPYLLINRSTHPLATPELSPMVLDHTSCRTRTFSFVVSACHEGNPRTAFVDFITGS